MNSPDIFCIDCKKRQIVYENELEDFDYYFDKRGKWKQIFLNFSELDKLREVRDGGQFWVEELDLLEVSESALMKKYSAISKLKKKLKNFQFVDYTTVNDVEQKQNPQNQLERITRSYYPSMESLSDDEKKQILDINDRELKLKKLLTNGYIFNQ